MENKETDLKTTKNNDMTICINCRYHKFLSQSYPSDIYICHHPSTFYIDCVDGETRWKKTFCQNKNQGFCKDYEEYTEEDKKESKERDIKIRNYILLGWFILVLFGTIFAFLK